MSPSRSTTAVTTIVTSPNSWAAARRCGAKRRASARYGWRAVDGPASRGVALSLSEAFRELRVVRGWVAIVALALGAYCLMAAVTAP
jgi:hypothetical protein